MSWRPLPCRRTHCKVHLVPNIACTIPFHVAQVYWRRCAPTNTCHQDHRIVAQLHNLPQTVFLTGLCPPPCTPQAQGWLAREQGNSGRFLVDTQLVGPMLRRRAAAHKWPAELADIIQSCLMVHPSQRAPLAQVHCRLLALADRLAAEPASA
jgi:hypothetical protein